MKLAKTPSLMDRMQRDVERFFPWDLARRSETPVARWEPSTDIYDTGDSIVFKLDLPGVSKDQIDVSVEDNRLTIEGERRGEKNVEDDERNYYRSERYYGNFKRSFTLNDSIDSESITAGFDDGVLTVSLPKSEKAKKHHIDVT